MWCRVVSGAGSEAAQPIAWRQAGGAGRAPQAGGSIYQQPGAADATDPRMEQRIQDAYQRGLRDGEAAASKKMADRAGAAIEQMAKAVEQLALHRSRIHREAEPELVRLSLTIARRILRRELSVDPEALLGLIKAGLEKIESAEIHRVRAHPDHAPVLKKLLEGAARPVAVAADPGLEVGAIVFETSRGALDAGLETQLREIERGFADIYSK